MSKPKPKAKAKPKASARAAAPAKSGPKGQTQLVVAAPKIPREKKAGGLLRLKAKPEGRTIRLFGSR